MFRRRVWCALFLLAGALSLALSARSYAAGQPQVISLAKQGAEAAARNDIAKALECFDEAIRLAPKWDELYYHRATIFFSYKHDLERTVSDCTKAVEVARTPYPEAFCLRAAAYRGKGEFKKAEADLRKVIEIDPKSRHDLGVELGQVLFLAGSRDKALAEFDALCKKDPGHYVALAWRGHTYAAKGEFRKAIADLTTAIELVPTEKLAYCFRAYAYFKSGDAEKALPDCNRVLKEQPAAHEFEYECYLFLYCARGNIRTDRGDLKGAMADFAEACRLVPNAWDPYIGRGKVHSKEKNFEKAVADFSEGIRLEPGMPKPYEMRADAYLALGEREKAAADEKKAKELRGKDAPKKNGVPKFK